MLPVKEIQTSADGTVKFLLQLAEGNLIETVYMLHPYGGSVCVTSQAGCSMGCAFCASGLLKKQRNLQAEEMLAQVETVKAYLQEKAEEEQTEAVPLSHIVVMGTGEPFDNYEEVIRFCDLVTEEPYRIAPRHLTVSTCGLVPQIRRFINTKKRYNLAISLHAPDNEVRNRLMPVNRKYPLEELLPAAADYCRATKRRVTFEYILLEDMNDSKEQAEKLAALLRTEETHDLFYVNLIPYNSVRENDFRGTDKEQALVFYDTLMKHGIKATLRKERGGDIAAACGQLRFQHRMQDSGADAIENKK